MDEIKLKDRAVSVLDKALGLQAGHAHRLQLQTQAAEQQIAALRDAQRAGLNTPGHTPNPTPNFAAHLVSAASCMIKLTCPSHHNIIKHKTTLCGRIGVSVVFPQSIWCSDQDHVTC